MASHPSGSGCASGSVGAAGAVASIQHLKASPFERARHQDRVKTLRALLDKNGIPHMPNPSHIVPVMVGDAAKCKAETNAGNNCADADAQRTNAEGQGWQKNR